VELGGFEPPTPSLRKMRSKPYDQGEWRASKVLWGGCGPSDVRRRKSRRSFTNRVDGSWGRRRRIWLVSAVAELRWASTPHDLALFALFGHSVPAAEFVGLDLDPQVYEVLVGVDPNDAHHLCARAENHIF
jgi:hypothetical protein